MSRSLGIDGTTTFCNVKNLQAIPCLASYHLFLMGQMHAYWVGSVLIGSDAC
jgi:hypothetical protein